MNCRKCGAELPENVSVCPTCNEAVNQNSEISSEGNALVGKEYLFTSSRGFGVTGEAKMVTGVKIEEDKLLINIRPRKKNICPVILLEDILAVEISNIFAFWYMAMAAVCLIAGFFTYVTFLFIPLWIWLAMNKKIVISQRNGVNLVIWERSKKKAYAFKEDLKKITKIN